MFIALKAKRQYQLARFGRAEFNSQGETSTRLVLTIRVF